MGGKIKEEQENGQGNLMEKRELEEIDRDLKKHMFKTGDCMAWHALVQLLPSRLARCFEWRIQSLEEKDVRLAKL